ncbi:MAG: M28 family peptidase [Candidatus Zixiibacteriota bacterium]|nr:MAG: M28 family peptidase [candidate division Zixibacteria bacterium]
MRIARALILIILAMAAFGRAADRAPAVVDGPLTQKPERLQALGFEFHARAGGCLIGTLPRPAGEWSGITLLPPSAAGFREVYQVDARVRQRDPETAARLPVLFAGDGWMLIQPTAQDLNALSAAGVPFRAIPSRPRPLPGRVPVPPEVDVIHPFVNVLVNEVSTATYQGYLQTLQDFVTRNTHNSAADSAAQWILQTLQGFGLTAELTPFQLNGQTKYNVIAQRTGTQYPTQVYYLIAHYDATAGQPIFPESSAPGADDDASGAALVLECARILAQYPFHRTVRFALFAGNEQGLLGSEAYCADLPLPGETCLGVVDANMVGWSGDDPWPPDLVVYRDGSAGSAALAAKVSEAAATYASGFLNPIVLNDPAYVYSDHAPFWDAGLPAVSAMEDSAWGFDLNPHYHSVEDLVEHLDIPYAVRVLKVLLATVADLAIPQGSATPLLTAGTLVINDSQGNNNGQIDYGESFQMALPVINAGTAAANMVAVILNESDPFLAFTDWQEVYGPISGLDTVTVPNAFAGFVPATVPDEHVMDITVTLVWGATSWQNVVQAVAHAPVITIATVAVNDTVLGNGNGHLDLGETADLQITLLNQGSYQAPDLTATLSTPSIYLTLQTPTAAYGTLLPGATAMRTYRVTASAAAPPAFQATFNLNCSAAGGWSRVTSFTLDVGDMILMPTGPDPYGYYAYDMNDEPFGPDYQWIEIDSLLGGPGTKMNFTNGDQTLYVQLPFDFRYYGVDYDEISVCTNGWIACGRRSTTDYTNSAIPNPDGPLAMIAPFWDDLTPMMGGAVWVYYDSTEHWVVVEYSGIRDYSPWGAYDTFEVILYDPVAHPTVTGDGKILMQYKRVDDATSCTVGIEDPSSQMGIQYLFNTVYAPTAAVLDSGLAVLFTTGEALPDVQISLTPPVTPIQIPPTGGSFDYLIAGTNYETTTQSFDVWCMVTLPNGAGFGPVLGPVSATLPAGLTISRSRTQQIPGGAPAGIYAYTAYAGNYPTVVWSQDEFDFQKMAGQSNGFMVATWANWGEEFDVIPIQDKTGAIPGAFHLAQNHPNPFNPVTAVRYELPRACRVQLRVYDTAGRLVRELAGGWREAGVHEVTFDASGLPSGLYLCRLQADDFSAVQKMVLVK